MKDRTNQTARRWDGWVACLTRAQLTLRILGATVEAPSVEDRWPARLIHVGAVLIGVSGVMLATWLQRRF